MPQTKKTSIYRKLLVRGRCCDGPKIDEKLGQRKVKLAGHALKTSKTTKFSLQLIFLPAYVEETILIPKLRTLTTRCRLECFARVRNIGRILGQLVA